MAFDIEKIVLVQSKVDVIQNNIYGFWKVLPPLGLYYLRTAIELLTRVPCKIIDENLIESQDWINNGIDGKTLVGFSVNVGNIRNSKLEAEQCKEKGAIVLFGGPHAALFGNRITSSYDFVDGVVATGPVHSEKVVQKIIKGDLWGEIDGFLTAPSKSTIKLSIEALNKKYFSKDEIVKYPDRSYIDMNPYFNRIDKLDFEYDFPFKRPMSVISHYGCKWRDLSGGCVFCSNIFDQSSQTRSLKDFWDEIHYLSTNFQCDLVRDLGEFCTHTWVVKLLNSRPGDWDESQSPSFSFYSRASEIDEEMCRNLAMLKTFELRIGIESGDDRVLNATNKGSSREVNERAVKLLDEYGIGVSFGIVLGLPGETSSSLQNTLGHIEMINKCKNILSSGVSVMLPIPGSKAFDMLMNEDDLKDHYSDTIIFDMEELQYHWLERFTNLPPETVYQTVDSVEEIGVRSKAYSLIFS